MDYNYLGLFSFSSYKNTVLGLVFKLSMSVSISYSSAYDYSIDLTLESNNNTNRITL